MCAKPNQAVLSDVISSAYDNSSSSNADSVASGSTPQSVDPDDNHRCVRICLKQTALFT